MTERALDWLCKLMRGQKESPTKTARAAAMKKHLNERPWLYYMPGPARAYLFFMMVSYCVARVYILVEDFVGLRRLPSSAFETVVWTQYLPQL